MGQWYNASLLEDDYCNDDGHDCTCSDVKTNTTGTGRAAGARNVSVACGGDAALCTATGNCVSCGGTGSVGVNSSALFSAALAAALEGYDIGDRQSPENVITTRATATAATSAKPIADGYNNAATITATGVECNSKATTSVGGGGVECTTSLISVNYVPNTTSTRCSSAAHGACANAANDAISTSKRTASHDPRMRTGKSAGAGTGPLTRRKSSAQPRPATTTGTSVECALLPNRVNRDLSAEPITIFVGSWNVQHCEFNHEEVLLSEPRPVGDIPIPPIPLLPRDTVSLGTLIGADTNMPDTPTHNNNHTTGIATSSKGKQKLNGTGGALGTSVVVGSKRLMPGAKCNGAAATATATSAGRSSSTRRTGAEAPSAVRGVSGTGSSSGSNKLRLFRSAVDIGSTSAGHSNPNSGQTSPNISFMPTFSGAFTSYTGSSKHSATASTATGGAGGSIGRAMSSGNGYSRRLSIPPVDDPSNSSHSSTLVDVGAVPPASSSSGNGSCSSSSSTTSEDDETPTTRQPRGRRISNSTGTGVSAPAGTGTKSKSKLPVLEDDEPVFKNSEPVYKGVSGANSLSTGNSIIDASAGMDSAGTQLAERKSSQKLVRNVASSVNEPLATWLKPGYHVYVVCLQEACSSKFYHFIEAYLRRAHGVQYHRIKFSAANIKGFGDGAHLTRKCTSIACFVRHDKLAPHGPVSLSSANGLSLSLLNGSKGAICCILKIFDQVVCFIGCHLPANTPRSRLKAREYIRKKLLEECSSTPDSTLGELFHHLVWTGDFNSRTCGLPASEVVSLLEQGRRATVLAHDEWKYDKYSFDLRVDNLEELPVKFDPTYKKIRGRYTPNRAQAGWSHNQYKIAFKEQWYKGGRVRERVPSYTDRILKRSQPCLRSCFSFVEDSYGPPICSADSFLMESDHDPIGCGLQIFPLDKRFDLPPVNLIEDENKLGVVKPPKRVF